MKAIAYKLTLHSDAEPGTGLGGDIVNERIPRDTNGHPIIPASHIKGLLREYLESLETGLAARCLGSPGQNSQNALKNNNSGTESLFAFSDLTLSDQEKSDATGFVSRTAVDEKRGRAKSNSLRTTERISAGSVFNGVFYCHVDESSREFIAMQIALFALESVGGNRNRGSGRCTVTIDETKFSPQDLLEKFHSSSFSTEKTSETSEIKSSESSEDGLGKSVVVRLIFRATSPICCPEVPVGTGSNRSGFAIPASAVQGMILTRLSKVCDEKFVTACYDSGNFRAWPLLPCGSADTPDEKLPIPTRVSLTHKVAKIIVDESSLKAEEVEDKAFEEIDWQKIPTHSPLKASDGVLLRYSDRVELWKAGTMPHIVTAHGVHADPNTKGSRNLYQEDAMAPLTWSGFVLMPEKVLDILKKTLETDQYVTLGRSRSIRGIGKLQLTEIDQTAHWNRTQNNSSVILIVQSPILLSDGACGAGTTATDMLKSIATATWKEKTINDNDVEIIGASTKIQFGWNRHETDSSRLTGIGHRLRASLVIQPGSIIRINKSLNQDTIKEIVQRGLGDGRERGFGAIAVHPGLAMKLFKLATPARKTKSSPEKETIKQTYNLWKSHRGNLPSPSQISALEHVVRKSGLQEGKNYLEDQLKRTVRIWETWTSIQSDIKNILDTAKDKLHAAAALRMLADLAIADKNQTK